MVIHTLKIEAKLDKYSEYRYGVRLRFLKGVSNIYINAIPVFHSTDYSHTYHGYTNPSWECKQHLVLGRQYPI